MTQEKNNAIVWRPASTVILAREREGELQIYLLKRSAKSRFFPGTYVFPGGAVEPEDHMNGSWEAHVDMDREGISERFGSGLSVDEAVAYGVSAIRETFEEAGVFLGKGKEQDRADLARLCDRRLAGDLHKGWFRAWVVSGGWTLAFSSLAPWAHWITPELMRKHFDTRFFVAYMPADQTCSPDEKETTQGIWISPEGALIGNLQGEIALSPPTVVTIHELLSYKSLRELKDEVGNRSWGETRFPRLVPLSKGAMLLQPWDPMRHEDAEINPDGLEKAILPVGAPFSRLWLHEGIWKPVAV